MFLARAGHSVTVMERFDSPRPIGAGLLIQPSGQAVLHDLGLLEEIGTMAAPVHRLLGKTASGRSIMDLRYAHLRADLVGMGISRAALFASLLHGVVRAGVEVRFGIDATSIELTNDQGESRPSIRDRAGQLHGPFDLLAIADGSRSNLRPAHLVRRNAQYPWGALWFTASFRDSSFDGVLEQTYADTRQMLGFLPIGRATTEPDAPRKLAVFWSIPIASMQHTRDGPLSHWKSQVARLCPRVEPLLEQISTWDQVASAPYHDVVMSDWHDGRVVYLGDAGHAMSPQLGMGANLALVDARTLAESVAEIPDVLCALRVYSTRRRANIRYYQRASRMLTPWFQSSRRWLAPVRDALFPLACKAPPFRRLMLGALAGGQRSWLRTMPPPSPDLLWKSP